MSLLMCSPSNACDIAGKLSGKPLYSAPVLLRLHSSVLIFGVGTVTMSLNVPGHRWEIV